MYRDVENCVGFYVFVSWQCNIQWWISWTPKRVIATNPIWYTLQPNPSPIFRFVCFSRISANIPYPLFIFLFIFLFWVWHPTPSLSILFLIFSSHFLHDNRHCAVIIFGSGTGCLPREVCACVCARVCEGLRTNIHSVDMQRGVARWTDWVIVGWGWGAHQWLDNGRENVWRATTCTSVIWPSYARLMWRACDVYIFMHMSNFMPVCCCVHACTSFYSSSYFG